MDPLTHETLANVIRRKRMAAGFNQHTLGRRVGRGKATISAWETGARKVGCEVVPDLAAALKMDPEYLAGLITSATR